MTHHFTDKEGLTWPLSLDLGSAEYIETCDFSLLHDGPVSLLQPTEEFIKAIYTNPSLVYALAYAACHSFAEEHGIDQQEFKRRMSGAAMQEVKEAWHAELSDFFPQMATVLSRLRELYLDLPKSAVAKIEKAVTEQMGTVTEDFEKQVDREIERMVSQIRGQSSEPSQPSQESEIGEHSLSGS